MTKNNLYHMTWKLRATGVLLLALSLSTFPMAISRAVKAQTPSKAGTTSGGEPKGGQKEGIKVHGHWIIDVRTPDGKLVTHSEFENELTSYGQDALGQVLARTTTLGLWRVQLVSIVNQSPWNDPGATLTETNDPLGPVANRSKTLTLNYPSTGPNSLKLVLSGNIAAEKAGTISSVGTWNIACAATVSPNTCAGDSQHSSDRAFLMTFTALPAGVNVVAGQIIQVTVVISFS